MGIGYKEQCIYRDGAKAFWSFDGDRFDRDSYFPEANLVMDDVDNNNPAVAHDDIEKRAFRIGFPSANSLEKSNQYSARFGNPHQTSGTFFVKSMLVAQHSPDFSFLENHGSFTIEFFFKKQSEWIADDINSTNRLSYGQQYPSKYAPIIRKAGVFQIGVQYPSNSTTYLTVTGPNGTFTVATNVVNFETTWQHLVLSFDVQQIDEFNWKSTQTLWLNNRIRGSTSRTHVDYAPNTNIGTPFEIGGFSTLEGSSTNSLMGDRNCYYLDIDQIAVYDFGFNYDKVCEHYKKTVPYVDMLKADGPWCLWLCNDAEVPGVTSLGMAVNNGGDVRPLLKGSYIRDQPGPEAIPTSRSIKFEKSGWMMIERWASTYYCGTVQVSSYPDIDTDYTIEMWFKSYQNNLCTLLSLQGYRGNSDWTGPKIELNKYRDQYNPGSITFTEARGVQIAISGQYTNASWYHLCAVRRGNYIELWLNGEMLGRELAYTDGKTDFPGLLQVFADSATTKCGPGNLSNFAIYQYALHPAQIKVRHLYDVGYEIKGLVTIQGNPAEALIRVYYSNTGAFVGEYYSDPNTGEYRIPLYSNSNVDLLVYDKYNKNVRYRAFGPVAPSGYDDYPITI